MRDRFGSTLLAIALVLACGIGIPAYADPAVVLIDGYIPRFAQKRAMNRLYASAFDELQKAIVEKQRRGHNVACSAQILTETSWLIQYTNFKDRVERRLEDLRQSLEFPAERQAAALQQSPVDGSWGDCYQE